MALSPLDGRYEAKIAPLKEYFSEAALIKYLLSINLRFKNSNIINWK